MRYFLELWYAVVRLALYIIFSRKQEIKRAITILDRIEKDFGGRFHPATYKKIAVSHGIYNPMICDAFAGLHGRLTNEHEKDRLIHYFICSSLFDDFTDHQLITEEQLTAISFQPQQYQPGSFDEKAFLNSQLLSYVKGRQDYDRVSHELFQEQLNSKKQYKGGLSEEDTRSVTFKKGGNSVLLCAYYLDTDTCQVEKACWYRIGQIIQLTNDLYDIWKDINDQIATLPNTMKDVYAFERFFLKQIQEMKSLIVQLSCSEKRKRIFSIAMAVIYAFGLIAIHQLKKIQADDEQMPDLRTLPRKSLIIDMEKPSNLIKWFRFVYSYARL